MFNPLKRLHELLNEQYQPNRIEVLFSERNGLEIKVARSMFSEHSELTIGEIDFITDKLLEWHFDTLHLIDKELAEPINID